MAVNASYTLNLTFNANGGSGAPGTVSNTTTSSAVSVTVSANIPSSRPTRSGYTFLYWSGNGGSYQPGSSVSVTFRQSGFDQTQTIAFSAVWTAYGSTWSTIPNSVQLDGATSYTFNVNKASTVDHHTMTFALGTETLTYTNVNTSQSVTFPTTWQSQIPNASSGTITCRLTSYKANESQVGSVSTRSVSGEVPTSVVPSVTVSSERVNSDATISAWNILLKGFSQIRFTASAAGANGSTVSSITFSGPSLSQTSTATAATSGTLSVSGPQTWTITVRDSRGRTASTTYTETVYDYSPPSISTVSASRCDSLGTINEASGTYALFNAVYAYSSANSHNTLSVVIDYKLHSGSTWTTLSTSYTSGTNAVIGGGAFDADKTYDIRLTITDSLGNSATYSVFLASVQGFALGLKNDRARFGGVPVKAGLQVDWDTEFNGSVSMQTASPTVKGLIAVDSGSDSVTNVATATITTHAVTFNGTFSSAPLVLVGVTGSVNQIGRCTITATDITTTGFNLNFVNASGATISFGANWVAIGI